MKKFYLAIAAAVLAFSANAQEQMIKESSVLSSALSNKTVKEAKIGENTVVANFDDANLGKTLVGIRKAAADATPISWYGMENTLYANMLPNFYSYTNALAFTSATDSLSFFSYTETAGAWTWGGEAYGTSAEFKYEPMGIGRWIIPHFQVPGGDEYWYGYTCPNTVLYTGNSYSYPLSNLPYYCDSVAAGTDRSGKAITEDFFNVGAGKNGDYAYGTDLYADTLKGAADRIDSILVLLPVSEESVLYIDTVSILVYKYYADDFIPAGQEITLDLIGNINGQTGKRTAKATAANVHAINNSVACIEFAFVKQAGSTGSVVADPVAFTGEVMALLTGFNEAGCDFGIWQDFYTPGYTTYFVKNGNIRSFWSNGGNNVAFLFNAHFMTFQNADPDLEWVADPEGGDVYISFEGEKFIPGFISAYGSDDVEVLDASEWITLNAFYEDDLEEYNFLGVELIAEELPAGETEREGFVTFLVENTLEVTVPVYQKLTTPVENINGDIKISKTIENGQVVILKGNKKFNVLGAEL